jgi:hypothetical protein
MLDADFSVIAAINRTVTSLVFAPLDAIIFVGEMKSSFYIVIRGGVDRVTEIGSGDKRRDVIDASFAEGEYFGDDVFLNPETPAVATHRAKKGEYTTVFCLTVYNFECAIAPFPGFQHLLYLNHCARMAESETNTTNATSTFDAVAGIKTESDVEGVKKSDGGDGESSHSADESSHPVKDESSHLVKAKVNHLSPPIALSSDRSHYGSTPSHTSRTSRLSKGYSSKTPGTRMSLRAQQRETTNTKGAKQTTQERLMLAKKVENATKAAALKAERNRGRAAIAARSRWNQPRVYYAWQYAAQSLYCDANSCVFLLMRVHFFHASFCHSMF